VLHILVAPVVSVPACMAGMPSAGRLPALALCVVLVLASTCVRGGAVHLNFTRTASQLASAGSEQTRWHGSNATAVAAGDLSYSKVPSRYLTCRL
jgi:hypothetical protein